MRWSIFQIVFLMKNILMFKIFSLIYSKLLILNFKVFTLNWVLHISIQTLLFEIFLLNLFLCIQCAKTLINLNGKYLLKQMHFYLYTVNLFTAVIYFCSTSSYNFQISFQLMFQPLTQNNLQEPRFPNALSTYYGK